MLAIQAPNGSQLEVPIPEQSGLKKKYQIHLKSTEGQIYVLLVNKDPDSDHPGMFELFFWFIILETAGHAQLPGVGISPAQISKKLSQANQGQF